MKLTRLILVSVMLASGFYIPAANAQYENLTPQAMLDALALNIQRARDSEVALNINLVTKQEYDQEKVQLDREKIAYDRDVDAYNADLREFNTEVDRYNADCDRQLTREEFDACEVRAERFVPTDSALNARLEVLNERQADLNARIAEWNQRDTARAATAEQLLTLYDNSEAAIEQLIERLNNLEIVRNNRPGCSKTTSPEAVHQCLQNIVTLSAN